ncbi:hypothetical protein OG689_41645 [Kitasatospora sp. NBC_00240]|uniref:hypothetical protein n=1 Tax=Kitasatospora sp. NBC_00240 TaxID=2903567 RepID=UPI00225B45EB|nr:hypothetical protein [Kitasatospora sp. NBC_00240]MCX5215662.1 hypothetical protein [Kitasatospora sp. NBC_00240]
MVTSGDHLRCPRAGTAKRAAHDALLLDWAARLEAAGFQDVTTRQCATVYGAPPPRSPAATTAHVVRDAEFGALGHTVTFDGYDGECRFELRVGHSYCFYQATSHTGRAIDVPPSAENYVQVVEAIAAHYDLPTPRKVTFA